jgi:hypothetical protein
MGSPSATLWAAALALAVLVACNPSTVKEEPAPAAGTVVEQDAGDQSPAVDAAEEPAPAYSDDAESSDDADEPSDDSGDDDLMGGSDDDF